MFNIGDTVRVCNEGLQSFDAIGTIVAIRFGMAKVRLTQKPSHWLGGTEVNYSLTSFEHYTPKAVRKSPSSNIAVFFDSKDDAITFLRDGDFCSENAVFDIVSAETLKDCSDYYEKLSDDIKCDIESLVLKGALYSVKTTVTFEEVVES